jgi:serine/threonine protein kinase/tetratricopeptide (TPR) repeat protein
MEKRVTLVDQLFEEALELHREERGEFLASACDGKPEVRQAVEELLAENDRLSGFLSVPPWKQSDETVNVESTARLAAGSRLGRYTILGVLGSGGMGVVYRARDEKLERTVVIKMLSHETAADSSFRRRFLNEARTASALNHPNIVSIYDICTEKNVDFIVMEYIDGLTLENLIARETLGLDQLAGLGSQVALALGAAHAAGIVHRDVKPANIMVTKAQEVKVLDFGIAKRQRHELDTRLTHTGQIIGTIAYMSPEQTRGEDTDHRSDVYSLGCVLYEAATGRKPFHAASALSLMHEIATADPEPPSVHRSELQPEFVRLVMRCLAKERNLRPDSAIELATELKSLTFSNQPRVEVRAQLPTVAVIPLKLRGPANDQYLSVSLAEALIHRLSSTRKLLVRPIASVIRYSSDEIDWARIARELNVDLVVEGTLQIAGGKIRVLVQIHRASDAETIASLKQDGNSDDLFALHDRLADQVSDVFVPRKKDEMAPRVLPTKHAGAYELYLRAVDRQVHVDKFEMASAIELLTRATELDPAFADAWGLLAQACAQMGSHLDLDPKWFELGEVAIARTLELDPIQCTALCARSMILWSPSRGFQNRAALRALNAAVKIDPSRATARHQRSAILWHLGFLDAAEHDTMELEVTTPALGLLHRGAIAFVRGNYDLSSEFYRRALDLEPNGLLNHLMSPLAVIYAGRIEEARSAVDKARKKFPAESFGVGMSAILAGIEGDRKRAETLADEAAQSSHSMTHTHHTWHSCAAAYALSGKPDKALQELERCATMGLPNHRLFEGDPYLQSLRSDSRFDELMATLRREHDSIRDEFGLEG